MQNLSGQPLWKTAILGVVSLVIKGKHRGFWYQVLSGLSLTAFLVISMCFVAPAALAKHKPHTFLLVWSSDKGTDDGHQDPDFLAVIDADRASPTYGKVLTTAALEAVPGKHLLVELGILRADFPSNALNEAHHMNEELFVGPDKHKYLFPAGLISANIFKCDVTDPLHIPTCTLAVDSSEVTHFSGTDDLKVLPNGNLIATYMGAKNGPPPTLPPTLTTPGGLVEFTPDGTVVAEYAAAKPGGPTRYRPSVTGETDAGLLAHPHGLDFRADLDVLITSDYADPVSLATSSPTDQHPDLGTTVRIWKLSDLAAGPQKIIQVPDGPRVEGDTHTPQGPEPIHEEPEGLMAVGLTHRPHHKGAFVASMCGGAIFYTPDITVANPAFTEVYDFGPCTGASVFTITRDDAHLILPVAGIQSPGDSKFDRDYPGEHARRVVVLDIRQLLQAGNNIQCGPPNVLNGPDGFTIKLLGRNNGAPDCPVEVGMVNVDSQKNYDTHGGPHFTVLDRAQRRVAFSNYFVDLSAFGLPGTGSGGDDKICIAQLHNGGHLTLDPQFRDELTGSVCVDFDRPTTYSWPNRGATGNAKPHAMIFVLVNK